MIDHLTLGVSDWKASRAFYERALAPLGWSIVAEWPGGCGFSPARGGPALWLRQDAVVSGPVHVGFRAPDRTSVQRFHEEALAAGGRDAGPPGPREQGEHSFGAGAVDPDGNEVEATCHEPPLPPAAPGDEDADDADVQED